MKIVKYKSCRAHAGFLVHAVPVRDSDPTKCGAAAACGKTVNESRRPVWFLIDYAVNCAKCLRMMAKNPQITYERISA